MCVLGGWVGGAGGGTCITTCSRLLRARKCEWPSRQSILRRGRRRHPARRGAPSGRRGRRSPIDSLVATMHCPAVARARIGSRPSPPAHPPPPSSMQPHGRATRARGEGSTRRTAAGARRAKRRARARARAAPGEYAGDELPAGDALHGLAHLDRPLLLRVRVDLRNDAARACGREPGAARAIDGRRPQRAEPRPEGGADGPGGWRERGGRAGQPPAGDGQGHAETRSTASGGGSRARARAQDSPRPWRRCSAGAGAAA